MTAGRAFIILMVLLFVVQIALPFFMIRIVPLEAGQQGYSSVFGYRIMERRLQLPEEPDWRIRKAPGFLIGLAPPLGLFKMEYATGVITIDVSPPDKNRNNPDPKAEKPFLDYIPFTMSHDRSTMTIRDPNFRFNTGDIKTSIPHLIEDDQHDIWEAEEKRYKRPLTPEERKSLELTDEEKTKHIKRYEAEYPPDNPDNRPVALDTQISAQGLIFSTWQFDLIVGSYETLGKNITRLAQDVLTELIARYTFGMLKNRKPQVQRALRRKLEEAIVDPDCQTHKDGHLIWRSWGFNLLEIAITNWGVSYYFNLQAMQAAAAGHYKQEQITRGEADRKYAAEVKMADVDVQKAMKEGWDPAIAREETIRSGIQSIAGAVKGSGLKAISIGNPSDLTHGIVAGVEAIGGNINRENDSPPKENKSREDSDKKPKNPPNPPQVKPTPPDPPQLPITPPSSSDGGQGKGRGPKRNRNPRP